MDGLITHMVYGELECRWLVNSVHLAIHCSEDVVSLKPVVSRYSILIQIRLHLRLAETALRDEHRKFGSSTKTKFTEFAVSQAKSKHHIQALYNLI